MPDGHAAAVRPHQGKWSERLAKSGTSAAPANTAVPSVCPHACRISMPQRPLNSSMLQREGWAEPEAMQRMAWKSSWSTLGSLRIMFNSAGTSSVKCTPLGHHLLQQQGHVQGVVQQNRAADGQRRQPGGHAGHVDDRRGGQHTIAFVQARGARNQVHLEQPVVVRHRAALGEGLGPGGPAQAEDVIRVDLHGRQLGGIDRGPPPSRRCVRWAPGSGPACRQAPTRWHP
jgi:hypothetical protein